MEDENSKNINEEEEEKLEIIKSALQEKGLDF